MFKNNRTRFLITCLGLIFLSSCNENKSKVDSMNSIQETTIVDSAGTVAVDVLSSDQAINTLISQELEEVQETLPIDNEDVTHPWSNLYQDHERVLDLVSQDLQESKDILLDKMSWNNQLKVKPDSWGKVMTVIMENSSLKSFLAPSYKQQLQQSGGLGVVYMTYVSPEPEQDGADKQGNYYSVSISENYPDRVTTLEFIIFDLVTMKAYVSDPMSGQYITLEIPADKLASLKNILID